MKKKPKRVVRISGNLSSNFLGIGVEIINKNKF